MKRNPQSVFACAALAATVVLTSVPALAAGYDDQEALQGAKEVKVAFDVTSGDGKVLLARLNIIDETRQSLINQGVTPHFIISFRGPATKLVQSDVSKMRPEDREISIKIAEKLKEMRESKGVDNLEQCAVAVREQKTRPEDVVPSVKVVGNAWISLMAYQNRGYAYISP